MEAAQTAAPPPTPAVTEREVIPVLREDDATWGSGLRRRGGGGIAPITLNLNVTTPAPAPAPTPAPAPAPPAKFDRRFGATFGKCRLCGKKIAHDLSPTGMGVSYFGCTRTCPAPNALCVHKKCVEDYCLNIDNLSKPLNYICEIGAGGCGESLKYEAVAEVLTFVWSYVDALPSWRSIKYTLLILCILMLNVWAYKWYRVAAVAWGWHDTDALHNPSLIHEDPLGEKLIASAPPLSMQTFRTYNICDFALISIGGNPYSYCCRGGFRIDWQHFRLMYNLMLWEMAVGAGLFVVWKLLRKCYLRNKKRSIRIKASHTGFQNAFTPSRG